MIPFELQYKYSPDAASSSEIWETCIDRDVWSSACFSRSGACDGIQSHQHQYSGGAANIIEWTFLILVLTHFNAHFRKCSSRNLWCLKNRGLTWTPIEKCLFSRVERESWARAWLYWQHKTWNRIVTRLVKKPKHPLICIYERNSLALSLTILEIDSVFCKSIMGNSSCICK